MPKRRPALSVTRLFVRGRLCAYTRRWKRGEGRYRIGVKWADTTRYFTRGWFHKRLQFPRSALRETNADEVRVVGTDRPLGLREAFREQSLFGGQGVKQCACRASVKQ